MTPTRWQPAPGHRTGCGSLPLLLLHPHPWPLSPQGINSTFELYLQGGSASAFSVSPTTIVGTGEVQILVQNPSEVDYEISHVMVVQVGPEGQPSLPARGGHSRDTALPCWLRPGSSFDSGELGRCGRGTG